MSTRVAAEECYSDDASKDIPENNNLSLALEEDFSSSLEPIAQGGAINHVLWGVPGHEGPPLELEEYYSDDGSEDMPENSDLFLASEKDFSSSPEPIFQEGAMNDGSWEFSEPEGPPPIIVSSFWFGQFEEKEHDIAPTNMHFDPFSGFNKVGIEPLGNSLYSIDEASDDDEFGLA